MNIDPIHDEQGNRIFTRDYNTLVAELTSIAVLKGSIARTLTNINDAITRYPEHFLGNGHDVDILRYALNDVHDRHLASMSFYHFRIYCQLRSMAKQPSTESIFLHYFRWIEAYKENKSIRLSLARFGALSGYVFSQHYPGCQELYHKKVTEFKMFEAGEYKHITLEHIVPDLFSQEEIAAEKKQIDADKMQKILKAIKKIPGGHKLIEKIEAAA